MTDSMQMYAHARDWFARQQGEDEDAGHAYASWFVERVEEDASNAERTHANLWREYADVQDAPQTRPYWLGCNGERLTRY